MTTSVEEQEVEKKLLNLSIEEEAIIFNSFAGKSLKLDKSDDVSQILSELDSVLEQATKNDRPVHIQLSGNTIGVSAAEELSKKLMSFTTLQMVDLSDIFTGRLLDEVPQALSHLCGALEDKDKLLEVNLSHNAFGPAGTKSFSQLLKNNHKIQSLKVVNNGLGITGGTIIAEALQVESDKKTLPVINRFEAGRNRLENQGAMNLANAFKKIGTLTALHLPQNGIRPEGVSALADAISVNAENFTELNLSDNTLKAEGATAVANAIKKMKSLKYLNLGDCLLTPQGGIAIAEAIKDHDKLEHLDLVFNELDDEAAEALLESVKGIKSLKSVELNGNEFSKKTLNALQKALGHVLGTLSDNEDDDEDDE